MIISPCTSPSYLSSSLKSFHWGVDRFDQCYFLRPPPPLDLFLAGDSARGPTMRFEPHKIGHVVLLRKSRALLLFVLPNTPHQIVRHARVQHTRLSRKHVNMEGFVHDCL